MKNRYEELSPENQGKIDRLVNEIASHGGEWPVLTGGGRWVQSTDIDAMVRDMTKELEQRLWRTLDEKLLPRIYAMMKTPVPEAVKDQGIALYDKAQLALCATDDNTHPMGIVREVETFLKHHELWTNQQNDKEDTQ